MRSDDVLGAKLETTGKRVIVKAEAKSRIALLEATLAMARKGLAQERERPSAHSLTQFAERVLTADGEVGEAASKLQLLDEVRAGRAGHLTFLFTGNDPSEYVTAAYRRTSTPSHSARSSTPPSTQHSPSRVDADASKLKQRTTHTTCSASTTIIAAGAGRQAPASDGRHDRAADSSIAAW